MRGIRLTKKGNRIDLTESLRFKILERDRFTCQYCGAKAPNVELHVDHIIPIARGGLSTSSNLVTACVYCNSGKSSRQINPEALVLKEIDFELNTEDGRNKRNTTIIFELFNQDIKGVRIVQNEQSRSFLQSLISKYGIEKVKAAVPIAKESIIYNKKTERYDWKTIIASFKKLDVICARL